MRRADLRTAAVLSTVFGVVAVVILSGSRHPGWLLAVLTFGAMIGAGMLVYEDSSDRGRGGGRWVAACLFLAPVGIALFLFTAVVDRLRGRRGIESRWDPTRRWYLLGAVCLVVVAGVLALRPVRVADEPASTSAQRAISAVDGYCDSPLAVALDRGPFQSAELAGEPAALRAATLPVAERCQAAAATRMTESEVCLLGCLLLALVGAQAGRRRKWSPEEELAALTA